MARSKKDEIETLESLDEALAIEDAEEVDVEADAEEETAADGKPEKKPRARRRAPRAKKEATEMALLGSLTKKDADEEVEAEEPEADASVEVEADAEESEEKAPAPKRARRSRAKVSDAETAEVPKELAEAVELPWKSLKEVTQGFATQLEQIQKQMQEIQNSAAQTVKEVQPIINSRPQRLTKIAAALGGIAFVLSFISLMLAQSARNATLDRQMWGNAAHPSQPVAVQKPAHESDRILRDSSIARIVEPKEPNARPARPLWAPSIPRAAKPPRR